METYGADWDGPLPSNIWGSTQDDEPASVQIPVSTLPLTERWLQVIDAVDPLRFSEFYGVDIYREVCQLLERTL